MVNICLRFYANNWPKSELHNPRRAKPLMINISSLHDIISSLFDSFSYCGVCSDQGFLIVFLFMTSKFLKKGSFTIWNWNIFKQEMEEENT